MRLAGLGARLAGDDIHHGGLAGAVGSDDAAQLARLDDQAQAVERLEAVEADGHAVEIEDRSLGGIEVHFCSRLWRPSTPSGSQRVTTMKRSPRAYSHSSGAATVSQLLAPLISAAPRIGPSRVPRPPTATQMAISTEFAGDISEGLMIPTDRKSTRLNSSHEWISYAVFCLKKKNTEGYSPAIVTHQER